MKWSMPYYGVQHTPSDARGRYCTVVAPAVDGSTTLLCFTRPYRPSETIESEHPTVDAARTAGERWLTHGVLG